MARLLITGETPFRIIGSCRMNIVSETPHVLQISPAFEWEDDGCTPKTRETEAAWSDCSDEIPSKTPHLVEVYGESTFRLHGNTGEAIINY